MRDIIFKDYIAKFKENYKSFNFLPSKNSIKNLISFKKPTYQIVGFLVQNFTRKGIYEN